MDSVKLEIKVIDSSIGIGSRQTVTGIVFFDFGSFQFPESEWNDSIVVILGWWLASLKSFIEKNLEEIELRFMDGPFFVSIQRKLGDVCNIRCEGRPPGRETFERSGSALQILKASLRAAIQVQKVCHRRGWQSEEIQALEVYVNESKALVREH